MKSIGNETFKKMGTLALEHLNNNLHREFIYDTIVQAKACRAIVENIPAQLKALELAYNAEMQASLVNDTYQELTEQMNELNSLRNKEQTALKAGFRAMMGVDDVQRAGAATMLLRLMDEYKLHSGINFDKQSAELDSFIADVEKKYRDLLEKSGVQEIFYRLKELNEQFSDKVVERDQSAVGKGVGRMRNSRKATDAAFREFREAVNAYAYVQGDEGYRDFIGFMNSMILRYKQTHLKKRKTRAASESSESFEITELSESSELLEP